MFIQFIDDYGEEKRVNLNQVTNYFDRKNGTIRIVTSDGEEFHCVSFKAEDLDKLVKKQFGIWVFEKK